MNNFQYKILISACLLGKPVRYDAKSIPIQSSQLDKWKSENILLPICPEILGGLPTPRDPAEIQANGKVITKFKFDVTSDFLEGASKALEIAQKNNIKIAILSERSPSCGIDNIYDGNFGGKLIKGQGVTTQLLQKHGIKVFNQFQLKEVSLYLSQLEILQKY